MEPIIQRAKELEDAINARADLAAFDDGTDEEDIEIQSELPPPDAAEQKSEKKATTVMKAYRSEPPLPPPAKRPRNASTSAAAEAMKMATSFFQPSKVQERQEQHLQNAFQITQLTTLQTELRDARLRIDSLQDRLGAEMRRADQEARRADQLEFELKLQKMMSGASQTRRRYRDQRTDTDDERDYRAPETVRSFGGRHSSGHSSVRSASSFSQFSLSQNSERPSRQSRSPPISWPATPQDEGSSSGMQAV